MGEVVQFRDPDQVLIAKNRQMEADAAEIRFRSERRLGELLAASPKNAGARGVGKSGVPKKNPTLEDAGIDKKLSSRAQKLAAVPDEKFEGMVADWRDRPAPSVMLR